MLEAVVDEICHHIVTEGVDILAVTETWLDDSIQDSEICPNGFSILRNDRNRRGGGVAFYISNLLHFKPRLDLCVGNIETVWMEVFPGSKRSMLLCCAYKSPSIPNIGFYDSLISECDKGLSSAKQNNLTILGDFNSDLLKPSLPQTKCLNELCRHLKLVHLKTEATRVVNGAVSLIDVILTNNESCFRHMSLCPFSGSDHQIVATHFVPRGIKARRPHKYVKRRNYLNLNKDAVTKVMNVKDIWEDVLSIEDLDVCVDCFSEILVCFMD